MRYNIILQYFDCLRTMFNILLIVAGILEYIILGIDFKVDDSLSTVGPFAKSQSKGCIPKYLPRWNLDRCCFSKCLH